ncbi:ATP-binding protein [Micromonospora sp. LAH09]|uniref:AAA family ATPase n=1 Tax=Micromonospora cabrerizensis TaxID=2911213 RepID=UPI001EE7C609|nr:ATP-binding protein [Micromonospora cabrerizensis]MCG5473032.1 ATP-binding protein [Micromonospora cabrerizensis]
MTDDFDAADFARQFRAFMTAVSRLAPAEKPSALRQQLESHLGREPDGLPVLTDSFPVFEHPNVQVALDAYLDAPGRTADLLGISGANREHHGLADIVNATGRHQQFEVGAVDYVSVPVAVDTDMTCVSFGLLLVVSSDDRLVVLMRVGARRTGSQQVQLEVLTADVDVARRFLDTIRKLAVEHSVFRGQVLSFESHEFADGLGPLRFHRRPEVDQADVILPPGALKALHRHVVGTTEHRARLQSAGHRLRRGVVLYGPPGTGKTHTLRHLIGRAPAATVLIVTGFSAQFIREACTLARTLEPAIVVLEDVDLVAQGREHPSAALTNPFLAEMLNMMDGMAEDADVTFLLTTNRLEVVEEALVQRPGRVDLLVEVPLPDETGRSRLLALYGRALLLSDTDVSRIVASTSGVSASFFAELGRRAELLAATSGDARADVGHVMRALDELHDSRSAFGKRR